MAACYQKTIYDLIQDQPPPVRGNEVVRVVVLAEVIAKLQR